MIRAVGSLQLPIPWPLRALTHRPLTVAEELLEVLSQDGEPIVSGWAQNLRGRVRGADDLVSEVQRLEVEGGPVARSLAASVRHAWEEFAGAPLPAARPPAAQRPLPLR